MTKSISAKHSKLTYQERKEKGDVSITIWLTKEEIATLQKMIDKAEKEIEESLGAEVQLTRTGVVRSIIKKTLKEKS